MSDSDSDPDRFADLLAGKYVKSEFDRDGRMFLPEKWHERWCPSPACAHEECPETLRCLDDLLTEHHIANELGFGDNDDSEEISELVSFIRGPAKKVFAILAYVKDGNTKTMRRVMKAMMSGNFNDRCLPIGPQDPNNTHVLATQCVNRKGSWWKADRIAKFYDEQWRFLAPVLSVGNRDADFRARSIMPFTERYDDTSNIGEGGFGQVGKFRLHEWHLVDPSRPASLPPVPEALSIRVPASKEYY